MMGRLPLPTLLSFLLVAFTIEFDNESEHRLPHKTTNHGSTPGSVHAPWLVSLVMWLNCMRFVNEEGITVRELEQRARTKTNLNGMERWGYISVRPNGLPGQAKSPRSTWLIRPTRAGNKAQEVWRPLADVIELRWQQRFGKTEVEHLRQALSKLAHQMETDLPDCLPILGYGLFSRERLKKLQNTPAGAGATASDLPLPSLLSKVLLAFAVEFEVESEVSLAVGANVLRLISAEGVRVRDLPQLAGVSKESIAMCLTFLTTRGHAVIQPELPGSRVKVVLLTSRGQRARESYLDLLTATETYWQKRYGDDLRTLRKLLETLVDDTDALSQGLEPYPDGWRASVPRPQGLPHYPMVLHRGGFPDGS